MDEQTPETPTLPQRQDRGVGKSIRRRRLLAAQDWCQQATLENPRYKFRIKEGLQLGTLHPSIEKAVLDIAWGKPQTIDKRLLDALGSTGRGLTMLLRKALTVDPLAEPKTVEGRVVIDQPKQEESVLPALPARASIVPPSRPKRVGKATLGSNEEEIK
jgi:hypothetical protein